MPAAISRRPPVACINRFSGQLVSLHSVSEMLAKQWRGFFEIVETPLSSSARAVQWLIRAIQRERRELRM